MLPKSVASSDEIVLGRLGQYKKMPDINVGLLSGI